MHDVQLFTLAPLVMVSPEHSGAFALLAYVFMAGLPALLAWLLKAPR